MDGQTGNFTVEHVVMLLTVFKMSVCCIWCVRACVCVCRESYTYTHNPQYETHLFKLKHNFVMRKIKGIFVKCFKELKFSV